MSEKLEQSFGKFERTALKLLKEERAFLLGALHKIAFEPFGKADASAVEVLQLITDFSRETFERIAGRT